MNALKRQARFTGPKGCGARLKMSGSGAVVTPRKPEEVLHQ